MRRREFMGACAGAAVTAAAVGGHDPGVGQARGKIGVEHRQVGLGQPLSSR